MLFIIETKLKNSKSVVSYNLQLEGYDFVHADTNMNAGGVGFYIKKNIKFHVLSNIPPLSDDCESLWLEILTNQGNFVLGVVYRHLVSNHTLFREMFLNTIRYLSDHKHTALRCIISVVILILILVTLRLNLI